MPCPQPWRYGKGGKGGRRGTLEINWVSSENAALPLATSPPPPIYLCNHGMLPTIDRGRMCSQGYADNGMTTTKGTGRVWPDLRPKIVI